MNPESTLLNQKRKKSVKSALISVLKIGENIFCPENRRM